MNQYLTMMRQVRNNLNMQAESKFHKVSLAAVKTSFFHSRKNSVETKTTDS